ncbi:hypothetical protein Tco_0749948 [Tanacetum coccineum]|uniref:Reverse transcriptase domain-containing protein n=1 Tax=Tanacetum coccineum TaxID=301880 RepID=A0ABQ4Z2K6_9ASTR
MNPKRRNRRRSKQRVEPLALEEVPVVTMADQRTMAELLRAPTEGYAETIVVPPIPAEHFELKHSLINLVTSKQFFGFKKEDPHAHIRYFNKITSTLKYKDVPETSIKLMLFPFSIDGPARIWLDKEPSHYILTWDDLFEETFSEAWDHFKDLLRACPHHGFTELHQLDTFYNGLNPSDQDSLNSAAGGNLLERSAQDSSMDLTLSGPRLDADFLVADSKFMKVAFGVGFKMIDVPSSGIVTTSRYVVPTGRVKVPAGRYVVPTGKDNVIVSAGRTKVIPAGRTILVLVVLCLLRVVSIVS